MVHVTYPVNPLQDGRAEHQATNIRNIGLSPLLRAHGIAIARFPNRAISAGNLCCGRLVGILVVELNRQ